MQDLLEPLRATALRHASAARTATPLPGLAIHRADAPTGLMSGVYEPMLCLVLQGAKEVLIGDQVLRYDPQGYFIASLDLPATGRIVEASVARPYLAVSLRLSRDGLAALLPGMPLDQAKGGRDDAQAQGFAVSPVTRDLIDPWTRLLALLDAPADIPVLAPLIEREILYRLLQGPQGPVLRQIATGDSRLSRVRRAIEQIRSCYDQPLRIEDLASLAGMSPASFHRHFKAATAMSPLQFQKTLRLQHARSLLIATPDVSRAGYAVGYESASQFSREYARQFGAPPARDAVRLRGETGALEPLT
jgi:AraC-like DNA-binding protein